MFSGQIPGKVNHRKLCQEKREIKGLMPVDQLVRFTDAVDTTVSDVEVKLAFRKGRQRKGLMVGRAAVRVSLICQNCMQPVECQIEASYRHALLSDQSQFDDLHEDEDGLVCDSDMVAVADLIEDELLLALPMVARHESGQCAPEDDQLEDYQSEPAEPVDTYKPFAGLAELTKEMKDKS